MITFVQKKEDRRIKTAKPETAPPRPQSAKQEDLRQTEIFKAMNPEPRKNPLDYLENYNGNTEPQE